MLLDFFRVCVLCVLVCLVSVRCCSIEIVSVIVSHHYWMLLPQVECMCVVLASLDSGAYSWDWRLCSTVGAPTLCFVPE